MNPYSHLPNPQALPILVIEDLDEDYETVVEAAQQAGIPNELIRARTLAEAKEAVAPSECEFSFVILDVNLPDGIGAEFVRVLRKQDALCAVPIVVFSTSDSPRDLVDLYKAGASAYHVKALRYHENIATLKLVFMYWLSAVRLSERATS